MNTIEKLLRRRQYIVDRKFQMNLVYRTSAFLVFVLLMLSAGLFLPLIREVKHGDESAESYETVTALLYMHEKFWPVALCCLVISVIGTILVSHRVAGPLVRVKRFLVSLQEGRFPAHLRIRKNDYIREEVELLNRMAHSLETRITEIQKTHRELQKELGRCVESAEAHGDDTVRDTLTAAAARADQLREQLEFFRPADCADEVAEQPTESPAPAAIAIGS